MDIKMKFLIGSFIFFSSYCLSNSAKVLIPTGQISKDKLFDLIVETDFSTSEDDLDIRPLFQNFIIGNIQSKKTEDGLKWTIPLQPVSSGTLAIPSLKIGSIQTEPTSIVVNGNSENNTNGSTQYQEIQSVPSETESDNQQDQSKFQTELSTDEVIENQLFSYTVITTSSDEPVLSLPEYVHVLPEHNSSEDKMIFNDHFQNVHTYQFFLYSTNPGNIDIYAFSPKLHEQSEKSSIHITASKNDLISQGISIEEHWEPNSSYITPNTPLIRIVKITGINNGVEQLPNVALPQIPGVEVYADDEHSEQKFEADIPIAIREIKQIFISKDGKSFAVPETKITWWNLNSHHVQDTVLPSRKFEEQLSKQELKTQKSLSVNQVKKTDTDTDTNSSPSKVIWFVLGLLCVVTVLSFIFRRKIIYKFKLRKFKNEVRIHCMNNNAKQTYQALLTWANFYYDASYTTLEQLPFYHSLSEYIILLEKYLFSENLNIQQGWNGREFLYQFNRVKK